MSEFIQKVMLQPGYPAVWKPARIVRMLQHLERALARKRQCRRLLELDDRLLDDIGVSREQALAEARKPFWR